MERVAFLVEETSERIICLLNPEDLLVQRRAGIKPRQSTGGHLTGRGLPDDPLLYTGGGQTVLTLNLLFDVDLADSELETRDVRDLTAPLWNLTENRTDGRGFLAPPTVRFLWGKRWNVPGVILSVAERFEAFDGTGAPARSWLRMKMLRVVEPELTTEDDEDRRLSISGSIEEDDILSPEFWMEEVSPEDLRFHEITGGERLDDLAHRFYGDPSYWRLLASFNDLDDPNDLEAGNVLRIPPAPNVVWQLLVNYENMAESGQQVFSSTMQLNLPSRFRVRL